jgi:sigma-B regulation protein RsbU (phosphoserine phosphatase)
MKYCNAGHNAPVIIASTGEVKFMEVTPNLPLGLFGGFPYTGQEYDITQGASLFLYTDGVTEAENKENALYSDERLLELLAKQRNNMPCTIVDAVLNDVNKHADGAEQSDDITIMCIVNKKP